MNTLLYNPFIKIAGFKSLIIGCAFILITSFFAYLYDTHFSGLLDINYGSDHHLSYINFLLYIVINVLSISIILYVSGLIVSKSSIRFIDIIGTQSLARFPMIIAPFLNSFSLIEKGSQQILYKYLNHGENIQIIEIEWFLYVVFIIILIILIIWVIALMYNAYKVSCNVKGNKAIISFIIALILAEVLSLILNYTI